MNDAAGRFQLMPTAISSPGVDWITGSDKGPFIDTGHEVQFGRFGRLYLSVDTVREMAEAAGLFDEGRSASELSAHAAEYFRGYSDAVKENTIGHLTDIAARLGSIAAALDHTGGVALEGSPEMAVPDVEDAGPFEVVGSEVFTTDGPVAGQVNRPARSKRAARLSSGAGDEHRL